MLNGMSSGIAEQDETEARDRPSEGETMPRYSGKRTGHIQSFIGVAAAGMIRRYPWRRILGIGVMLLAVSLIVTYSNLPRSPRMLLGDHPEQSAESLYSSIEFPARRASDKRGPNKHVTDKGVADNGASENLVHDIKARDKRVLGQRVDIPDNGETNNDAPGKHSSDKRERDIDCTAILSGNTQEIKRAKERMESETFRKTHRTVSDAEYIKQTQDCYTFKTTRNYFDFKAQEEEKKFPIAFTILLYRQVEQAERLLRAIYRPFNIYCLNVDADAEPVVHEAINGIADCFPNVFVVPQKEHIVYAGFTRLQADLNCMKALLKTNHSWKYFINLPSQSFPIKTNTEMVRIMKMYNGFNDIEGITGRRRWVHRFKYKYIYKSRPGSKKAVILRTKQLKDDPPYNVTVVKGSAYGFFSRKFVEFACTSQVARDLLEWCRDVKSPDEYFWATLNHNPQIGTPGAFTGKPEAKPWLVVYVAWRPKRMQCDGKFVRGTCIFGVGDVHGLLDRPELFVNKFHLHYQPYGLGCLEEWHRDRSAMGGEHLNMSHYNALPFNRN